MPGMIALPKEEAIIRTDCMVELKIDGSRMSYSKGKLTSDRNINRNARYGHVLEQVSKINWKVRGEMAIPNGNVLQLNKKENWHKANYYIFDLYEIRGLKTEGMSSFDIRALIDEELKRTKLKGIHAPLLFDNFEQGWDYVLNHDAEGVVLKEADGINWKVKYLKEEKLQIIGHEAGKAKGAFKLLRNGVECRCSGTSVAYVEVYKQLAKAGKKVYAEIEYAFLTDEGIPFQPRLRRVGTLQDLKYT